MTTLTRRLFLAFSALGAGAATTSAIVHYRMLTESGYSSFCDVNETVNCTQAYMSQYGYLFGVPVALFGLLFFVVVFLLAWLAGRAGSSSRESVPAYVFALSTVGLAFVLYLGWASYFVLKAFCMLCAITYVAVIVLFVASGAATSVPMTSLPGRAWADARRLASSPLAFLVVILLLAGAGSAIAFFPREAQTSAQGAAATYPPLTESERVQLQAWWQVQPKEQIPLPDLGAKVVFLKFSDFMCPACRKTYEDYRALEAKFAGNKDVVFLLKHYPLEGECNPNAAGGSHHASCEAAAAVVMARSTGKAHEMEAWLWQNQATLSAESVKKAAREIGGINDFDARYASALQEVRMDASLGGLVKVTSTPTFFINGLRIIGGYKPQAMEGLIQLELDRTK